MCKIPLPRPALLLLLALAPAAVRGQGRPSYDLGEVVVTADEPRVVDEITTSEVVTAEEIARSGARTLDEAIELLPGLYVRAGGDGVPRIDMRGLRTRHVLLLLNGVPLNSTFDGQFDPATLSVENIAYVKLTRGASSMLYGPGGNGGVINIVTRGAGAETDASVLAEGGISSSANVRGQASTRAGDVDLLVSGSWYEQDDYELADDFEPTPLQEGGRRINSDREDGSAFASLTFEPSDRTELGIDLSYRTGELGKPPPIEDNRTSDFATRARFERVDHEAVSLHAALSHAATESLTIRPSLYFNRGDELTDGFDDTSFSTQEGDGAFREDASTTILGGTVQIALATGSRGLATVALDGRSEDWDAQGFRVVRSGGGGGGGGGRGGGAGNSATTVEPVDDRHSVGVYSLAAEYELHPGGPFSAVLGAGYAAQSREESATDDDVTFLLGARYAWRGGFGLRGSVARQMRFPTLRDLYEEGTGNPELSPERTLSYELGLEREIGARSRVELVLFEVDAEDFIERPPSGIAENLEALRFRGVELQGRHRLPGEVRFSWGYTYLDSENRSSGADITTLQNRPEHKLALAIDYAFPFGLELRAQHLYVADSYALSRSSPTRALNLGDYGVLDLRLAQPLLEDRLQLVARATNLLDEDYVESYGFPQPGRRFFLGVELGTR